MRARTVTQWQDGSRKRGDMSKKLPGRGVHLFALFTVAIAIGFAFVLSLAWLAAASALLGVFCG